MLDSDRRVNHQLSCLLISLPPEAEIILSFIIGHTSKTKYYDNLVSRNGSQAPNNPGLLEDSPKGRVCGLITEMRSIFKGNAMERIRSSFLTPWRGDFNPVKRSCLEELGRR